MRLVLIGIIGVGGALVLTAAQRPAALGQTAPGLWEISGLPGAKVPARQCVTDMALLARYEHRNRSCTAKVISDDTNKAVIEYSCGGAGFGHTKLEVITPRSLHIETQGVSDNLPFNYVLEARRVGDCPAPATTSGH